MSFGFWVSLRFDGLSLSPPLVFSVDGPMTRCPEAAATEMLFQGLRRILQIHLVVEMELDIMISCEQCAEYIFFGFWVPLPIAGQIHFMSSVSLAVVSVE